FTGNVYKRVLILALGQRRIVVAVAVALFVMSVGVLASGILPYEPMPKTEGDTVTASVRLPYGVPIERTEEVREILEEAAFTALDAAGGRKILRGMFTNVGSGPSVRGPHSAADQSGSHLLTVEMFLVPMGERKVTIAELAADWSGRVPTIMGLEALTFEYDIGPGAGAAVDAQLSHTDVEVLAAASSELTTILKSFSELADVANAYAAGKTQFDYHLLPNARTLGLTSAEVARQVRSSFYGAEALREQRGRQEVKVMFRLPKEQRQSDFDLENLRVKTPAGGQVPLPYVAELERSRAPTEIKREDGRRVVNVTAGLAPGVRSAGKVMKSLNKDIYDDLIHKYDGLRIESGGMQRENAEAMESLGSNYLIALFVIFALLAIPFRSYSQPLIIMSAIPFGFVGAVGGHLLMGYELSMISVMGIIALSGVVVNDSLVLIDTTNRARAAGMSPKDAIVHGGLRRLRPILLTSFTTFFGLAPMIFETSVQARFLIPMAVSLGFGILFATLIVLLVVPVLFLALEERRIRWGMVPQNMMPSVPPQ
ncbi:MAG: efflux RND transporter permease subunit, partial [Proteobacteria bacterium]|nr:efflux RND transporter permease subunit [Pseudomonadota bacterium]